MVINITGFICLENSGISQGKKLSLLISDKCPNFENFHQKVLIQGDIECLLHTNYEL